MAVKNNKNRMLGDDEVEEEKDAKNTGEKNGFESLRNTHVTTALNVTQEFNSPLLPRAS